MEEKIRAALKRYYENWLFVLPATIRPGPPAPPKPDEGWTPPSTPGTKTLVPKAVQELKPKSLLTQNMSRPDLLSWERSMRSYFKASNFDHCSNDIRICYLEERMDPASQQLLRKLCNGEPERYSMENLYKMIREYVVRTDSLQQRGAHHPDAQLPTAPRRIILTDAMQVRRDRKRRRRGELH